MLDLQGSYEEIQSLDQDLSQIEEAESVSAQELQSVTQSTGQQYAQMETVQEQAGMEGELRLVWKIREKRFSPAA